MMAKARKAAEQPPDFVIHDDTPMEVLFPHAKGRGYDPATVDHEMHASPTELQIIPRSEWDQRLKDKADAGALLSQIRLRGNDGQPVPSLDQGQVGYCWAHSITHATMLQRMVANQPYVPLSAYAIAATIKKGADEGGWCGLSAKFAREKGIPAQSIWPQGDRHYKQYDTAETWADAAKHKTTEDWVDLSKDVYDQNLTFDQVATCALLGVPGAVDYNWWGHSIAYLDLVSGASQAGKFRDSGTGKLLRGAAFDRAWGMDHPVTAGYGLRIWNSWADSWGEQGTGVLTASKAVPDGSVAIRVTGAT
jgi:hypothetical protein